MQVGYDLRLRNWSLWNNVELSIVISKVASQCQKKMAVLGSWPILELFSRHLYIFSLCYGQLQEEGIVEPRILGTGSPPRCLTLADSTLNTESMIRSELAF